MNTVRAIALAMSALERAKGEVSDPCEIINAIAAIQSISKRPSVSAQAEVMMLGNPDPQLEAIGRKWIAYAQEQCDTNDIAAAIWNAIGEVEKAVTPVPEIVSLERDVGVILRENGWTETRMGSPSKNGFYLAKCSTVSGEFIGLYHDKKHEGAILLRKIDVDAPQIAIDFARRVDIEAQAETAIANHALKDTILLYEKDGCVAKVICSEAESKRLLEDLREQVCSAFVYTYPGRDAEMLYAVTNIRDRIDDAEARLAHEIRILANAPRDWSTWRAIMTALRTEEDSVTEIQHDHPRG